MIFPLDPDTVSHGIQLSVAPVFLLTAVSGMIGVVSGRLARIIDRARHVEQRVHGTHSPDDHAGAYRTSSTLPARKWLISLETRSKAQTTKRAYRGLMVWAVSIPKQQTTISARV